VCAAEATSQDQVLRGFT